MELAFTSSLEDVNSKGGIYPLQMGAAESREIICTFNSGKDEVRSLLRDKDGKYVWKTEGKVSVETPVDVLTSSISKTPQYIVPAWSSEWVYWLNLTGLGDLSMDAFTQTTRPKGGLSRNHIASAGAVPNEKELAKYLWFRPTSIPHYILGFPPQKILCMTIKAQEPTSTPFTCEVWCMRLSLGSGAVVRFYDGP